MSLIYYSFVGSTFQINYLSHTIFSVFLIQWQFFTWHFKTRERILKTLSSILKECVWFFVRTKTTNIRNAVPRIRNWTLPDGSFGPLEANEGFTVFAQVPQESGTRVDLVSHSLLIGTLYSAYFFRGPNYEC